MGFLRTSTLVALLALLAAADDLATMQAFVASLACSDVDWATNPTVCNWDGVNCDSNNNVISLSASNDGCTGSIATWALPATLTSLSLYYNSLTGTLPPFTGLPAGLTSLDLSDNSLSGSLPPLSGLPSTVQTVSLNGNSFTGTISLASLPASIETIDLNNNKLSGTVTIPDNLPSQLEDIYINNNQLTGAVIGNVSLVSISTIDLSSNLLTGPGLNLVNLPAGANGNLVDLASNPTICGNVSTGDCNAIYTPGQCDCAGNVMVCTCATPAPASPDMPVMKAFVASLACSDTNWATETDVCSWSGVSCDSSNNVVSFNPYSDGCTGSIATWALPPKLTSLSLYYNSLTGTLPPFTGLPTGLTSLDLSNNNFKGTPVLSGLPSSVTVISLSGNAFTGTPLLTSLPASLTELHLSSNQFSGTVLIPSTLPKSLDYIGLSSNMFTGAVIGNVSGSALNTIDLEDNSITTDGLALLTLDANSPSDLVELTGNPTMCSTVATGSCSALWLPSQCSCAKMMVTCSCSAAPYTPVPNWTPNPGQSWSPYSWSPNSIIPSGTASNAPVPTLAPGAPLPTAVWISVNAYGYGYYSSTINANAFSPDFVGYLLASYFGVSNSSVSVQYVNNTAGTVLYFVQFVDFSVNGVTHVSASSMAATTVSYAYNQLWQNFEDANLEIWGVYYVYGTPMFTPAPLSVFLTVTTYYSTVKANAETVQTVLATYFMVSKSAITVTFSSSVTVSMSQSLAGATGTATTFLVTFQDNAPTTNGGQLSAAYAAGVVANYQYGTYSGLSSAFNYYSYSITGASLDYSTPSSSKSKVPIIVGVIVGVVVLIAIIAFIANRRSQGTGRSDQDYVAMSGKPMV